MPSTALIRSYRVGQARFLRHCIDELLYQTRGDHVEGTSTQWMIEHVSDTLDRVVEQVIAAYESARERWVHNRSAVLTMRVKAVLPGENLNLAESALRYRLQQRHLGVVLWVANTASGNHDPLDKLGRVASALAVAAGSRKAPLFVACDETSAWAWAWLAITPEAGLGRDEPQAVLGNGEPAVLMALGEPASGVEEFRRTLAR